MLALAGCGGGGRAVAYNDVSARFHGFQPPRLVRQVFETRAELTEYLRRAMPGRAPAIPPIDWAHREAILVSTGPRSSTGYALDVVSVHETSDRIALTVRERTPSLGHPVVARVTYPTRLITIPRTPKRLLLHIEGRP